MEEGNPDLDEADLFKYELFLADFNIQTAELEQSESAVSRLWNHILQPAPLQAYRPADPYLQESTSDIETFETYRQTAMRERPELRSITAGMEAARLITEASRSQNKPAILLGITASYANTPNRPRQTNPFIINSTNYANAGVGIVLRQNLNFNSVQNQIEKNEIRYRKVQDLERALTDGLMLELTDAYNQAQVARITLDQTKNKLQTAKNWVRHEQLNWDLGFGNVDNLIEAVQKEFELRVELAQNIFDYNLKLAKLHKAAGMSLP
jgi:outer membrane protein TolC